MRLNRFLTSGTISLKHYLRAFYTLLPLSCFFKDNPCGVVPFFVRDAGACRQPCFLAGYRLLVCRGGRLPAGSDGRTWAFRSRRRPASLCFRPWVSVSGGAGVPGGADRLGQWCPYRDFPLSCPSSGFVRANGFQGKFEKIPGTCNVPGIRSVCRSRFISRSLCRCQGNPRP